jgi:molecular chaperone DnaK
MVKEAEANAAEDAKKREEIEAHNQLDGLIYQVEKFLRENGDKLPDDAKSEVEGKLPSAKEALESNETARMQEAYKDLAESYQKVGTAMHEQAAAAESSNGASADGAEGKEPEGDVVDAEFKEV